MTNINRHAISACARIALLGSVCLACAGGSNAAHAQVVQTVLHKFTGGNDGANPTDPLLIGVDGSGNVNALYGTATYGNAGALCEVDAVGTYYCGSVFSLRPGNGDTAWTSRALWDFGGYADEDTPIAGLLSPTGLISGKTTLFGTTTGSVWGYNGSVFTLVGKTLTTIWSFSYSDGNFPYGGVIADKKGALYATTIEGGANGCGTVVQLVPPAQGQTAWTENVLWNFAGGSTDGCSPYSTLIADASGALYGTTLYGDGAGGVFKLTPPAQGQTAWTEQMLYGFTGGSDGGNPFSTLTFGANGVLYGTTAAGGNGSGGGGSGVVFQLTPPAQGQTAWTEQVLWTFTGGADGAAPLFGALLVDANGALYGTASGGGSAKNVPVSALSAAACSS